MDISFAGTYQGTFTSNGSPQFLSLPAGVSYITTYNLTQMAAAGGGQAVQCYWQNGMTAGQGIQFTKTAVTNAAIPTTIAAGNGFYFQNTTAFTPGASVVITGITNAAPPLVTTGTTTGLNAVSATGTNGSIVRIYSTVGALQLQGLDFSVGTVTPATSFTLPYMAAIANASPGAGSYRIINYPYFYPNNRYITAITQANPCVVTLSVSIADNPVWQIGQKVRFVIPSVNATAYGMTQLNGQLGTITAITTTNAVNAVSVNIDTTGYTAFAFPLTANTPFTAAQLIPVGENTAQAIGTQSSPSNYNMLADSEFNTGQTGMLLMAGANAPAGVNADVIYWVAGRSWNV
jgi:hypothetical protein